MTRIKSWQRSVQKHLLLGIVFCWALCCNITSPGDYFPAHSKVSQAACFHSQKWGMEKQFFTHHGIDIHANEKLWATKGNIPPLTWMKLAARVYQHVWEHKRWGWVVWNSHGWNSTFWSQTVLWQKKSFGCSVASSRHLWCSKEPGYYETSQPAFQRGMLG